MASVRAGEGPSNVDMSDRRSLLVAALGFVVLENWRSVPEVVTLHAWLDTWSGLGAIVVGMDRHGYELWLAKRPERVAFDLPSSESPHAAVGQPGAQVVADGLASRPRGRVAGVQ